MKRTLPTHHAALALLSLCACTLSDKNLGGIASATDTEAATSSASSSEGMTSIASTSESSDETAAPDGCSPGEPYDCAGDYDRDGLGLACDNAAELFNPDQSDIDGDGAGDVLDLCPTVAGASNTADSDDDGIGNDCDSCRFTPQTYNDLGPPLPGSLQVRNIPDVGDRDGDGIGDACDNCVTVANCEAYDFFNPWTPGDPIAADDPTVCQRDDDMDMIGDACAGMQGDGAAGPVGFGDDDDFDQDGLTNALDGCVRLPINAKIACTGDAECPEGTPCETDLGVCNHRDADGDGVGDACDTCVTVPNFGQLIEGKAQADDEDADFVGQACDNDASLPYANPRPLAFWSVVSEGQCCTTLLAADPMSGDLILEVSGAPLLDPDGLPIRVDCVEPEDPELRVCRALPPGVAQTPGILTLPLGCDVAGHAMGPDDVGGDLSQLWRSRCELPQLDQDFDGIGDVSDFCPFAFDPENLVYVDDNGMAWEQDGKYCNGDYSPESICEG